MLEVLDLFAPPFLAFQYLLESIVGLFAHFLFFLADVDDLIGKLERLVDDLGDGFFVELCLLGQLKVVVVDSLLEHP